MSQPSLWEPHAVSVRMMREGCRLIWMGMVSLAIFTLTLPIALYARWRGDDDE